MSYYEVSENKFIFYERRQSLNVSIAVVFHPFIYILILSLLIYRKLFINRELTKSIVFIKNLMSDLFYYLPQFCHRLAF